MGSKLNIPEADALRRAAAALATALSSEAVFRGQIDTNLSTGLFFRSFPWSGVVRKGSELADYRTSTVGQYFATFNWEGQATLTPWEEASLPAAGNRSDVGGDSREFLRNQFRD